MTQMRSHLGARKRPDVFRELFCGKARGQYAEEACSAWRLRSSLLRSSRIECSLDQSYACGAKRLREIHVSVSIKQPSRNSPSNGAIVWFTNIDGQRKREKLDNIGDPPRTIDQGAARGVRMGRHNQCWRLLCWLHKA